VLAALLLLPLADLAYHLLTRFPGVLQLLHDRQTLAAEAFGVGAGQVAWGGYVLLLALLSAVAKEVAFRGWILNGLRQRFRPWAAILISSLLFAAFHMNVFALLPTFLLGVVLGVLAVRSGSIVPGILLHVGCYAVILAGAERGAGSFLGDVPEGTLLALRSALAVVCTAGAIGIVWGLNRRETAPDPAAALLGFAEPPAETGAPKGKRGA
jgi:membrane protease YdiL (CAAX protease family)